MLFRSNSMARYIFITGGVVSSLGKGLASAALGALLQARGFSPEDFAQSHPGGALGRRLLTHVRDVMHPAAELPVVTPASSLADAVLAISRGGLGMTVVCDADHRVLGIFTDGDLRRAFENGVDIHGTLISDVMHANPQNVHPEQLAVDAVQIMDQRKINALLVTNQQGQLVGALNMHDLLNAKVV